MYISYVSILIIHQASLTRSLFRTYFRFMAAARVTAVDNVSKRCCTRSLRTCVCGQVSAPHLIRAPRGWPWVPAYLVPNGRKQSHNAGVLLVGIRQYSHLG